MAKGYGSHSTAFKDLTGQTFGNWTVDGRGDTRSTRIYWMCRCSCGVTRQVSGAHLANGRSRGCGCIRPAGTANPRFRHGESDTAEHNVWMRMINRCSNENYREWHLYGGRGIKVCDRWLGPDGFANFLADMGRRPSVQHSIDRYPDNNKGYEPGNCRWATATEQGRNTRRNLMVDLDGCQVSLAAACEATGINYDAAKYRLKAGHHWRGVGYAAQ